MWTERGKLRQVSLSKQAKMAYSVQGEKVLRKQRFLKVPNISKNGQKEVTFIFFSILLLAGGWGIADCILKDE